MAFRFVRLKGAITATPIFIDVYGSGTIQRGSVVEFDRVNKRVAPATANSTYTNIFGIALDYIQGASEIKTRVIPFVQGQLWEADCNNTPSTVMIFIKHALTNAMTLANTSYDQTVATGIFMAYTIETIRVNTMIGEFIRAPIGFTTNSPGYF